MTSRQARQIAAMRRQIAELKRERVTYLRALVDTVDLETYTFTTSTLPDLGALSAPPKLLPAVGEWVRIRIEGATPSYVPGNISEYLTVSGTNGDLLGAMDPAGVLTGSQLTVAGDPVFGGRPLEGEILTPIPRFVDDWANYSSSSASFGTTEIGIIEFTITLRNNRRYVLHSGHLRVNSSANGITSAVGLRYEVAAGETAPSLPTTASPIFTQTFVYNGWSGAATVPAMERTFGFAPGTDPGNDPDGVTTWRFLLWAKTVQGTGTAQLIKTSADQINFWFTDHGPWVDSTEAVVNTGGGGGTGGTTPTTRTLEVASNWYASWRENGTKRTDFARVYQGQGDGAAGNQQGAYGFASLTSTLSGATVKRVQVYLTARNWYYNSGGTGIIGVHGHLSEPATLTSIQDDIVRSAGWPKPGARWVDLPSTHFAGWVSGSYRGVMVGPASAPSDKTFYGWYDPSCRIKITYTK